MTSVGDRLDRFILVLVPAAVITVGYGVSLMPRDLVVRGTSLLAAWLTLSLPVGVLVGHCVPDEAERM